MPIDSTPPSDSSQLKQTDVFISGQDGSHTYRIPSVVVAPDGRLLAFCEARRTTGSDTGDIDLVLKRSADGGATWGDVRKDQALIDPRCQASIFRHTSGNAILFSNPANTVRDRMTVRVSYDEGKTWYASKMLHPGPSAYSCLTVLPDNSIGCFYERGEEHPSEKITFARFSLEWLSDG